MILFASLTVIMLAGARCDFVRFASVNLCASLTVNLAVMCATNLLVSYLSL